MRKSQAGRKTPHLGKHVLLQLHARLSPLLCLMMLTASAHEAQGPHYTADGAFIPPIDYREWVFLSSGLDMSYSNAPPMAGHSTFDNVFVEPGAWAVFERTGHWPDKAMFALESRTAASRGSINNRGKYQTEQLMGLEFHVRDDARFRGGWGFFGGDATHPQPLLPPSAPCYECHRLHGAVESTFTQFYPTAKPIAIKAGTYLDR